MGAFHPAHTMFDNYILRRHLARGVPPCKLCFMDINRVISLHRLGVSNADIAVDQGVSPQWVSHMLRKHGEGSPKVTAMPTDLDGFVPPVKHRQQHAFKMMKAKDRVDLGLPVKDVVRQRLDAWRAQLDDYVWTHDKHGFRRVARSPDHGDKVFIRDL